MPRSIRWTRIHGFPHAFPRFIRRVRQLLLTLPALALVQCGDPTRPDQDSQPLQDVEFDRGKVRGIWLSAGFRNSVVYDLNNDAVAVGGDADGAVAWHGGETTHLRLLNPALAYGTAFGINDAGAIVGYSSNHATQWTRDGTARDLGLLPGALYSVATDISESGRVVGYDVDSSYRSRPLTWTFGPQAQVLPLLPGHVDGEATKVNDLGLIIGYSTDSFYVQHGVVWPGDGSILDLGPWRYLYGLNNRGVVVGADGYGGMGIPFLWTAAGGVVPIVGPDDCCGAAYDINDQGVIVGTFGPWGTGPVFWTRSLKKVQLVPPLGNALNISAVAINECGQMAGNWVHEWSGSFAFWWPTACVRPPDRGPGHNTTSTHRS